MRRSAARSATRIEPWRGWDKARALPWTRWGLGPQTPFYEAFCSDCRMQRSMVSTMIRVCSSIS